MAGMDSVSIAAETPSSPPSPSPPLEPQGDEDERGEVETAADFASPDRCVPVRDLNTGPQPPSPQQTYSQDAAGSSEVVEEEETAEELSEALRSFMEAFGGQGEECLIQSPKLKNIATPERAAALSFLVEKFENLLEKYKKQSSKCANECVPRYDGLKKKYMDECTERRRLYNELIEVRGNIRVFCRCRPLSADEVTCGCTSVVEIDPSCETELWFLPSEKEKKAFRYDHVFGPEDGQEVVFSETVPLVRSVMDGFNVCIFAYGQTGTGKTFTMEGVQENRGVNYRALQELFRMSEERSPSVAYTFSVSILEVYNEQINDLLDESSKRLEIKQNSDGTPDVPGLVDAPVYTTDGVWEKLKLGAANRSVGSTDANKLSSRSHSLVRVTVRSEHLVTGQQSKSYMWLVDLAGSERNDKTGAEGERLKESQYINKSLTSLGDVMSSLASKSSHIPYRNSKLTHLLKSSLGGDCKTLMFVQISPSSSDSGETLSSLKYATRVRSIELGPARKHADPSDSLKVKQLTEKLKHVEKENEELKRSLHLMELKCASCDITLSLLNDKVRDAERKCRDYQQRNKELENELFNEKKAARDPARSSRPPLVPLRQRQAPTIQNKENTPVMGTKAHPWVDKEKVVGKARRVSLAHPGADKENVVGKAWRVSLAPEMRQIPLQSKRRSSMAIVPSLSEPQRASRLSIAFPGAAARDFGSSSSSKASKHCFNLQKKVVVSPFRAKPGAPSGVGIFNAAPRDEMVVAGKQRQAPTIQNKENTPVMGTKTRPLVDKEKVVGKARRVSLASAHPGPDKENVVGKARRVSLTPVMRQIPLQPKRRSSMAIVPSLSEQQRASRLPIAFPGAAACDFGGGSSSKFLPPPGPGSASKRCFSIQKKVTVSPFRAKLGAPSGVGINAARRDKMVVVGRSGNAL